MSSIAIDTPSEAPAPGHSDDRERLVRLCHHLTGERDAAEDLAQETLVEAWCHSRELRDPTRRAQWLNGIARNRCLHWLRSRGREATRRVRPIDLPNYPDDTPSIVELLADDFDLVGELERSELAGLLDRAMDSLPPDTRQVLLARYVDDLPQARIAEGLGVSEGAVEARLQRGKRALRKVLTTDLLDDSASYGLVDPAKENGWEQTKLWCPFCGTRRLLGRFSDGNLRMRLACPSCVPMPDYRTVADTGITGELRDVRGYRAGVTRLFDWIYRIVPHRAGETLLCPICLDPGRPVVSTMNDSTILLRGRRFVSLACERCRPVSINLIAGITLALPEARRFWHDHPRIHILPEETVWIDGRQSLVVRYGAVDSLDTLDAVVRLDTLHIRVVTGGSK